MYRQPLSVYAPLNLIPASNNHLDDPFFFIYYYYYDLVHLDCIILLNRDRHDTFVTAWLAAVS